MTKDLAGKKLLILGGNPETTPLVEVANQMGVYTIVTSGRSSDPAKKRPGKALTWMAWTFPGLSPWRGRKR